MGMIKLPSRTSLQLDKILLVCLLLPEDVECQGHEKNGYDNQRYTNLNPNYRAVILPSVL